MDRDEQEHQIGEAKSALEERGYDVPAIMYPSGECDRNTVEIAREHHDFGFLAFIGASKGTSQATLFNPLFVNRSFPESADAAADALEDVVAYRSTFSMYFHGIGDDYPMDEEFESIVEEVAEYRDDGDLDVVTPADLER